MITKNPEINKLIKKQHEIYRKLDKLPDDKELQEELIEVTEQITSKTAELLNELKNNKSTTIEEVIEIRDGKSKNIKKEMNDKYKELILLYRNIVELLNTVVSIKKEMRKYMKTL